MICNPIQWQEVHEEFKVCLLRAIGQYCTIMTLCDKKESWGKESYDNQEGLCDGSKRKIGIHFDLLQLRHLNFDFST